MPRFKCYREPNIAGYAHVGVRTLLPNSVQGVARAAASCFRLRFTSVARVAWEAEGRAGSKPWLLRSSPEFLPLFHTDSQV